MIIIMLVQNSSFTISHAITHLEGEEVAIPSIYFKPVIVIPSHIYHEHLGGYLYTGPS